MALHWDWNDKMGEAIYADGHKSPIYQGNAQMIAVWEFEDGTYIMNWFTVSKDHLKNMLGLTKDFKDNSFAKYEITGFRFNTRYKSTLSIISELTKGYAKSKTPLTIELYYEEEK